MNVQELLLNIGNKDFQLNKDLEVKTYLPIEIKKTIAQGIIYESVESDGGALKIDSIQRYMAYIRLMITTHTNLQYTDDDYDVLCSTMYGDTNLLGAIMGCFAEDANECSRILGLMLDDYMHEMSVEYTVARFLNDLTTTIGGLATKISQVTENKDIKSILPENVDMNKINAFLSKYIK